MVKESFAKGIEKHDDESFEKYDSTEKIKTSIYNTSSYEKHSNNKTQKHFY